MGIMGGYAQTQKQNNAHQAQTFLQLRLKYGKK